MDKANEPSAALHEHNASRASDEQGTTPTEPDAPPLDSLSTTSRDSTPDDPQITIPVRPAPDQARPRRFRDQIYTKLRIPTLVPGALTASELALHHDHPANPTSGGSDRLYEYISETRTPGSPAA